MKRILLFLLATCGMLLTADNPKGNPNIFTRISDTQTAPTIDGTLNEDEWSDAAMLMPFSYMDEMLTPLEEEHRVYMKYDSENLYVGLRTRMDFDPAILRYKDDDKTMQEVDSFQIILERPGEHFWYSFLIERAGGKCDWRFYYWDIKPCEEWNPQWQYACRNIPDGYFESSTWEGEVSIPWKVLEMDAPKEKTDMQAQFFRYHGNKKTTSVGTRMTAWAPLPHFFNMPVSEGIYGTLEFMPGKPVFRPEYKFDNYHQGFGSFRGIYTGEKAQFCPRLWDIGNFNKKYLDKTVEITGHKLDWRETIPSKEKHLAFVNYRVFDEYGTVASNLTKAVLDQPFSADVQPIYSRSEMVWNGEITLPTLPENASVRYEIQDNAGKVLCSKEEPLKAKWFEGRLSIANVPVGDAVAVAQLLSKDGAVLYTIRTPFKQIEKPEWMTAEYGKVTAPFGPWKPMTSDISDNRVTLGVYKHKYVFSKQSPLPTEITLFDQPFSAGAWHFILETNHGTQSLEATKDITVSDKNDRGLTIHWQGESSDVSMKATVRVEFDAFSWYEVEIAPLKQGIEIRKLSLVAPLQRKGLRYIRGAGSTSTIDGFIEGALIGDAKVDYDLVKLAMPRVEKVSTKGWEAGWRPCMFYWVGGEDRGFSFALPSRKNMKIKKDYSAVRETDKDVTISFNLVDDTLKLDDTRRYEFAVVLTPAKDRGNWSALRKSGQCMPGEKGWNEDYSIPDKIAPRHFNDPISYRMMNYGKEVTLPYGYLSNNFLPCWLLKDCQSGNPLPRETQLNLLREMCKGYRKSGCKPYLWYDTMITTLSPNPPTEYLADLRRYPIVNHPIETYATACCPKGAWTDFYLYGLVNRIKDGIGSVYCDMSSSPTCSNRFHNCGVRNPDGSVTEEYPLQALREFYLRAQHILKSNDPDAIIGMHAGNLEWANHWIDINIHGEEWTTVFDYYTFTPELYQLLYSLQKQMGTMSQHFAGLIYRHYAAVLQKTKATQEEIMGLCLVNGDTIYQSQGTEIHGNAIVWNALDEFGVDKDGTEWIPYWRNPLSKYPKGLLISTWKRNGKELLAIYNFDRHDNPLELPEGKYYDTLRQEAVSTLPATVGGRRFFLWRKE